jgi:hypothetical protein
MATWQQLAIQKDEALQRLYKAMQTISQRMDVTPVDLPVQSKYGADYLATRQLELLATWAEGIIEKINLPAEKRLVSEQSIASEETGDPTPKARKRKGE